jgi:hypothetical protein
MDENFADRLNKVARRLGVDCEIEPACFSSQFAEMVARLIEALERRTRPMEY